MRLYFQVSNKTPHSLIDINSACNKTDERVWVWGIRLYLSLKNSDLGISAYYRENPIKSNPNKFARHLIKEKVDKILEYKLLQIDNNYLMIEFIISFVDHFNEQLGIIVSDNYSLDEIEKGFFRYLPIWLDEAIKFMLRTKRNGVTSIERLLYKKPYFNPDMLKSQIMKDEREEIRKKVVDRLNKDESISLSIGNEKYPMKLFHDFFIRLKLMGIKDIHRIYRKKDYNRLSNGGLIWNLLSEEALSYNLNIFFNNFFKIYSEIIQLNFPKISNKINKYKNLSGILLIYKSLDHYEDGKEVPSIRYYYLHNKENFNFNIFIYKENEIKELKNNTPEAIININKVEYQAVLTGSQILDFIYDDLPMFTYLYEDIKGDLNEYFENNED